MLVELLQCDALYNTLCRSQHVSTCDWCAAGMQPYTVQGYQDMIYLVTSGILILKGQNRFDSVLLTISKYSGSVVNLHQDLYN